MKKTLVLGALTALILCAGACAPTLPMLGAPANNATALSPTSTPPPTRTPPTARILRIGITTFPDVLDPQRALLGNEILALKLAYEGLTTFDEKGNVVSAGADRWTPSPDGLQLTFHIRDGLVRADGAPVTARDYEYAIKRALDPRLTHKINPPLLYAIKGAEEVDRLDLTKTKAEDVERALNTVGVKATDERNLTITFKKPNGYWHAVAATLPLFPADKKSVEHDPDNWWTRPDAHNGTGMFAITSIEQNKRIVFTPNPNYWRGKPKLDRLELVYFPGGKGLLDAYKNGDLDLAANLAPDTLAAINADANLKNDLARYPTAIEYAIAFNASRKPFDDRNVRLAFAQAFDRAGWVREVFKDMGKPYTRWIPPGIPGAQPDKPGAPLYDPKAAVQTLTANGYAAKESTPENPKIDCAKLGEIKLIFLASPVNQARYGFLAANFTQVFGCPITLEPINQLTTRSAAKPQLSVQAYLSDYAHPQNWLSTYWTCGTEFAADYGYCNKDLDKLLASADAERDQQKALSLYQQAEDALLRDAPAAFAHSAESIALIKPHVLGVRDHLSAFDLDWAGEWGPAWVYDIDLAHVPANYPAR